MSKPISVEADAATPTMIDNTLLPFMLPSVQRKKVTFDGGRITSDGGVMLPNAGEKPISIAAERAPMIVDLRHPLLVTLRRTLLPAHPCLRRRDITCGGRAAAAWHDTPRRGDAPPSARLVRRIRRHWPTTRLSIRGDAKGVVCGESNLLGYDGALCVVRL